MNWVYDISQDKIMLLYGLAAGVVIYLAIKVFLQTNPPPLYGVYAQPGKLILVPLAFVHLDNTFNIATHSNLYIMQNIQFYVV